MREICKHIFDVMSEKHNTRIFPLTLLIISKPLQSFSRIHFGERMLQCSKIKRKERMVTKTSAFPSIKILPGRTCNMKNMGMNFLIASTFRVCNNREKNTSLINVWRNEVPSLPPIRSRKPLLTSHLGNAFEAFLKI